MLEASKHAKERFKQRYGKSLTKVIIRGLLLKIKNKEAILIKKGDNDFLFGTTWEDKKMNFVINRNFCIITVYDPTIKDFEIKEESHV